MEYPPVASLSLQGREGVEVALQALLTPMQARLSPGAAELVVSAAGANTDMPSQSLEALSRMIWGLAPLLAGGGTHPVAGRLGDALAHGTDPAHPEYWGAVTQPCIRSVEMAPLGFAMALQPEAFYGQLPPQGRENLYRWLEPINRTHLWPNNWLFFRVLVNLGFARVGRPTDEAKVAEDLQRLEGWYLSDGWYQDGDTGRCDYYIAFAFHFYGLIYATLAGERDPERADRFRRRAAEFAQQYIHWFAPDGSSFPFGRSLIYRFAVASFWGALALAGVEALPWGVIKGLYLRNLRWWLRRPIFTETGLLTLGYGYPNLNLPETYSSPGSPYWAFKAFLPLALAASHPFWQAEEKPLPALPAVVVQKHPRMILCRDRASGHVVALNGGGQLDEKSEGHLRYGDAKYAKFAYSSAFGFSLPQDRLGLFYGAYDSMLALSDDGRHYRSRWSTEAGRFEGTSHVCRWRPWPDVEITTWLIPAGRWHVRIHRLTTPRTLQSAEGGFALKKDNEDLRPGDTARAEGPDEARVANRFGLCGIRGYDGRAGLLISPAANTNLIEPVTVLPMLTGELAAGTHTLACAVLGLPGPGQHEAAWQNPPAVRIDGDRATVNGPDGEVYFDAALTDES